MTPHELAAEMGAVFVPAWSSDHNHGFIGGLYIRPFGPLKAGAFHEGHRHFIDHATFVEYGAVRIDWKAEDGRNGVVVVEAPNFIPVKATAVHKVTALIEGTRYRCIFAEAEAEKLDQTNGPIPYMMGLP